MTGPAIAVTMNVVGLERWKMAQQRRGDRGLEASAGPDGPRRGVPFRFGTATPM